MPLRLPALSCSKPSSACLLNFSKIRKNGGVFRRFLLSDPLRVHRAEAFRKSMCAELRPGSAWPLRGAVLWRPTKIERGCLGFCAPAWQSEMRTGNKCQGGGVCGGTAGSYHIWSEAEIPPAGHREKRRVSVCRRRHGFRNSLRSSVSLCKKSGRISCRFWFVERPWTLT